MSTFLKSVDAIMLILMAMALPLVCAPVLIDHFTAVKWMLVYVLATLAAFSLLLSFLAESPSSTFSPASKIYLPWLTVATVFAASFATIALHRRFNWDVPVLDKLAWLLLTLVFVQWMRRQLRWRELLFYVLSASALLVTVIGMLQVLGINLLPFVSGPYPTASTFGNVNMTSEFLGIAVIYQWSFRPYLKHRASQGLLDSVMALQFCYLLFLASRSLFLALAVAAVFVVYWARALSVYRLVAVIVCGFALNIAIRVAKNSQDVPLSYQQISPTAQLERKPLGNNPRFEIWQDSIALWKDEMWTGVGPENFGFALMPYRSDKNAPVSEFNLFSHPHNEFVKFLVEEGLVVFLLGLSLLGFVIYRYMRDKWMTDVTAEKPLVAAMLSYYFVQAWFQFPLANPFPFAFFALVIAMMVKNVKAADLEVSMRSQSHKRVAQAAGALVVLLFYGQLATKNIASQLMHANSPGNYQMTAKSWQLSKSNWRAGLTKSWLEMQDGRFSQAQLTLSEVLEIYPNHYLALKLYYTTAIQLGQQVDACIAGRLYDGLLQGRGELHDEIMAICRLVPAFVMANHPMFARYLNDRKLGRLLMRL